MIGRQHDQRMFKSHLFVDKAEQVCHSPIQTYQVILHFEAGGAEQVADIVRRGKTNGQVVRSLILPQALCLQQGLGEIQCQFIPRGTDG